MKAGTVTMLKRAIAKEQRFIEGATGDSNPQVIAMLNRSMGRLEAFEAVLDSLRGTHCFLNIYAKVGEEII
jgi:hypothetical protein